MDEISDLFQVYVLCFEDNRELVAYITTIYIASLWSQHRGSSELNLGLELLFVRNSDCASFPINSFALKNIFLVCFNYYMDIFNCYTTA